MSRFLDGFGEDARHRVGKRLEVGPPGETHEFVGLYGPDDGPLALAPHDAVAREEKPDLRGQFFSRMTMASDFPNTLNWLWTVPRTMRLDPSVGRAPAVRIAISPVPSFSV